MSDEISAKMNGIEEAKKVFKELQGLAPDECIDQVNESTLNIETTAKQNVTVGADGALRASIHREINKKLLQGQVIANGGHAAYVEFGTKAHFPPPDALERWVRLVLGVTGKKAKGVAFLIARKISKRGTPAQPFLFPAYDGEIPNYLEGLKKRLKKAIARLGAGGI